MEAIVGYMFIFVAKLTDVSLATVRTIMVMRGKRVEAFTIGFVEVIVWILAIGVVLGNLDDPVNVIIYALGFASGSYVGIILEEKMALGDLVVQVITYKKAMSLIDTIREAGFGVTVVEGMGRYGINHLLNVTIQRKHLAVLYRILDEHDAQAFVTVTDARSIRGGYFTKTKRK